MDMGLPVLLPDADTTEVVLTRENDAETFNCVVGAQDGVSSSRGLVGLRGEVGDAGESIVVGGRQRLDLCSVEHKRALSEGEVMGEGKEGRSGSGRDGGGPSRDEDEAVVGEGIREFGGRDGVREDDNMLMMGAPVVVRGRRIRSEREQTSLARRYGMRREAGRTKEGPSKRGCHH